MALQALAAYSDKTKGRGLDLRVKIRSELDINWKPAEIHITKENALLRRAIDVSKKFMFCLKNEQKCIIYIRDFKIWDATTSRTRWLIKDWTCRTPSFAREK